MRRIGLFCQNENNSHITTPHMICMEGISTKNIFTQSTWKHVDILFIFCCYISYIPGRLIYMYLVLKLYSKSVLNEWSGFLKARRMVKDLLLPIFWYLFVVNSDMYSFNNGMLMHM